MITFQIYDRAHYNGQNGRVGSLSNSYKSRWFYPDGAKLGFPVLNEYLEYEKPVFKTQRGKPTEKFPHGVHRDVIALAKHHGHEMDPWIHYWIVRMAKQAEENIKKYP